MGYRDCSITNNRVTLEAMKGEVEMILSDEAIKNGLNYHNQWISLSKEILAKSHLEANARIRELETAMAKESNEQYKSQISRLNKEVRVAKNNFALAEQLLDWVDKAIEGEEVCDFAESFPLVRKAVDLYFRIQELEVKLWDLRKIIERNSKDLPSEFSQLLDDHFWEIAQAEKETK